MIYISSKEVYKSNFPQYGQMKSRDGKSQRREEKKKEDQKEKGKGRKVAKHCFAPMICGSGGSKSRRVRSQLARWEMKNCTPLWREAHLHVKKLKALHVRSTFGSCDVEKVHAVAARSTFRSQNVEYTSRAEHFWKLRCLIVHAVAARNTFRSQNVENTSR